MTRFINQVAAGSLIGLLVATFLVACGGGGGGGGDGITPTTTTQGKGTVGILLTDKPADPDIFTSINVTFTKVELMGSDRDGRVVLYSGGAKTEDLLRLKNEAIPFTFSNDVPAGTYCKIRLTLDELELVLTDKAADEMSVDKYQYPHLPGNGKLDLVVKNCFEVEPGLQVTIQLDLDARNSIHVNDRNFNFRPVIFVDILSQDFDGKLVRMEGWISKVDTDEGTLLLCDAVPVYQSKSMGCVRVHLGDDAAFFDNVVFDGAPRPLSELLADDKLGERITVVGWPRTWFRPHDHGYGEYEYEYEYEDEHVEYEHEHEYESEHEYDDHDLDSHLPWMAVDALAIEYGEFLKVEGEVATDADADGFSMTVTPGSPVMTDEPLDVLLQEGDLGVNGTRIVSKSGKLREYSSITESHPVQVDGVLDLTDTIPLLKAALVIIDTGSLGSEQITGTIDELTDDGFILSPEADSVCGIFTSDLVVTLTEDVGFLTVIITDEVSEIIPGGTLEEGQSIGMNGVCTPEGYETDNVVILEDQRD